MFETTIERLAGAGLKMYEISNFARAGHESRHNLVYWANDAYFGFGLGAARYVRGVRSINTRDLLAYFRRIEAGEPATGPHEELSAEGRARETAILMLRRTKIGIERERLPPKNRVRPGCPRRRSDRAIQGAADASRTTDFGSASVEREFS